MAKGFGFEGFLTPKQSKKAKKQIEKAGYEFKFEKTPKGSQFGVPLKEGKTVALFTRKK